jgi:acetylornithine deacetylase
MSPVTHLRRQAEEINRNGKEGEKISTDAFLTTSMADFSRMPGMPRDLERQAFVDLLRSLIAESKHLQNNPRLGIHPEETRAAKIVMKELEPYTTAQGGPLVVEELEYTPKRSNLKVVYPGTTEQSISFVGSHFDVVPADAEAWDKDPFSLTEEGDKLYGRGTTDCLGHVALLTQFLVDLAKARPRLKRTIVVLFIAGEEGGEMGVGVDVVVEKGKLAEAKNGPVYWVDSADSQPCCGTAGMLSWSLKASGRVFHSGFPHKGINSIEMAMEGVSLMQRRFYEDFAPHPSESGYGFAVGSHMKPTQIECAKGSINQICPECTVSGDIRLSPFYEVEDVVHAMESYVKDLNDDVAELPVKGPYSKFSLADEVTTQPGELRRGTFEIKWHGGLETFRLYAGVACRLDSEGHKALIQACRETYASVRPFSVNGSLPLVKMMQKQGFDIQLLGFGLMSVYHGVNEYCQVSDMKKAYQVLVRVICLLESTTS